MPQLILEYTGSITNPPEIKKLFLALHTMLHDLANAELESCKSRSRILQDYLVGDGNNNSAFVHLDISLLAGRSQIIKEQIGNTALQLLQEHFYNTYTDQSVQFTVKVNDMPTELYFKKTIA